MSQDHNKDENSDELYNEEFLSASSSYGYLPIMTNNEILFSPAGLVSRVGFTNTRFTTGSQHTNSSRNIIHPRQVVVTSNQSGTPKTNQQMQPKTQNRKNHQKSQDKSKSIAKQQQQQEDPEQKTKQIEHKSNTQGKKMTPES